MRSFRPAVLLLSIILITYTGSASANIIKDTEGGGFFDIRPFVTFGDMEGILNVTATFADGATSTLTWTDLGGGLSGVREDDQQGPWTLFGISQEDTFPTFDSVTETYTSGIWTLTNEDTSEAITELTLWSEGKYRIVFDATLADPGTEGTLAGMDFTPVSAAGEILGLEDFTATYSIPVLPLITDPEHDAFLQLSILLPEGGIAAGQSFYFVQDTDIAIPLPSTMALLALGLGLLPWIRRRSRHL
ncbi:hypothetical protein [Ectothiorhodospira variabilis]|uniref:hypothetical protein n=1 Tax=Ectothiorhodospira variabilis TaxID=505694 RepID=UPI001EFC0D06|nr:hypothetical protein [Ectothiorhodospira variabilis]MCG5497556.1 hypothetical protein [Ectothiorhodospira variabilis]